MGTLTVNQTIPFAGSTTYFSGDVFDADDFGGEKSD